MKAGADAIERSLDEQPARVGGPLGEQLELIPAERAHHVVPHLRRRELEGQAERGQDGAQLAGAVKDLGGVDSAESNDVRSGHHGVRALATAARAKVEALREIGGAVVDAGRR